MNVRFRSALTALVASALTICSLAAEPVEKTERARRPDHFKNLRYRSIGPASGGRCTRAAGVPGDPLVYYFGAANGGVWKTTDGGLTWKPIFDDQPVASIGSLAIAPSDPNVIYVGTGEANIRGNVAAGNGIYKSGDGGKTWAHVWKQEGQIGTMIVHPRNPDIAFAAVLGHAFGPNEERGVYRTQDGGKTWQRVLGRDKETGASDVCFDPSNPRVLFAGLWQARRRPWEMTSGGPGSGLYTSRDGGDSWKQLSGNGLPEGPWGKVGVAVAPSDPRRVYALIEADKGGLFRSDDGGEKWQLVSASRELRQRPFYYTTLTVDPRNADIVWCPQVPMLRSIDGGRTFRPARGIHHGDHHDIWIDATDPRRMISCNDGGVDITTNGGETWSAPPLPIAQFYHVAADNRTPYHVSGAMQDLGTASGPSNNLSVGGIGLDEWHSVGGGEAGFTAPDPFHPEIIYAGEYGGVITRYDDRTHTARNVSVYPTAAVGHGGADLRYRFQWTAPIVASRHELHVIFHGANVLFRSDDEGLHWTAISPDLTRNDKSKEQWSGGPITGDNTGVEIYCTIFSIAESPRDKNLLWVGSDDGLVHVTRDGGKSWDNVTPKEGMPEWGTVACLEPSPYDPATAYLVVDAHRLDDMKPYLFKTTDYGKTWQSLTAKLPADVYLHAVREDPKRRGLLFLGTERGVSYSTNGGRDWHPLKLNLPTVPVHDLVIKDNDLVVATHGRSIWILDDITPIREMTAPVAQQEMHLFPIQPATRWQYALRFRGRGARGENPPRGALIEYYLRKKPAGEVKLEVLDEQGKLVNSFSSKPPKDEEEIPEFLRELGIGGRPRLTATPGINRFAWDLRYAGATLIPKAQAWGDARQGPLVLPGTYTVKLTVDGKSQTGHVEVRPDPRIHTDPAALQEQLKMALTIRDDITRLSRLVSQLRSVKAQLAARKETLKDIPRTESLIKLTDELTNKLDALEGKMHNAKAEITYDLLAQKGGAKLYSTLGTVYGTVADSDTVPTQGAREVYAEALKELRGYEEELRSLLTVDLAKINAAARELELPYVIVPQGTKTEHRGESTISPKK